MCGLNLLVLLAKNPECERVKVLDRRPPAPQFMSEADLDDSKVEFIEHTLGSDSDHALDEALRGCDCVFSVVTPHVQLASEADFYQTNLEGVKLLVRVCTTAQIPRLVYLSSIAVSNHFTNSVDQKESDPLAPIETYTSPYDITKRKGEDVVLEAGRQGNIASCALRPGGILCGPSDFTFRNVFQFKGIIPKPSGMRQIDFIDARDVVRAMLMAAQALKERPEGVVGEAFWATKGEALDPGSIAEIASRHMPSFKLMTVNPFLTKTARFGKFLKYHSRRALRLENPGIPPHRFLDMAFIQQTFDNSKIQNRLGFYPKVKIEDAVARICRLQELELAENSNDRCCF